MADDNTPTRQNKKDARMIVRQIMCYNNSVETILSVVTKRLYESVGKTNYKKMIIHYIDKFAKSGQYVPYSRWTKGFSDTRKTNYNAEKKEMLNMVRKTLYEEFVQSDMTPQELAKITFTNLSGLRQNYNLPEFEYISEDESSSESDGESSSEYSSESDGEYREYESEGSEASDSSSFPSSDEEDVEDDVQPMDIEEPVDVEDLDNILLSSEEVEIVDPPSPKRRKKTSGNKRCRATQLEVDSNEEKPRPGKRIKNDDYNAMIQALIDGEVDIDLIK